MRRKKEKARTEDDREQRENRYRPVQTKQEHDKGCRRNWREGKKTIIDERKKEEEDYRGRKR